MSGVNSILGRGMSGGTITSAPPPATDRTSSNAYGQFQSGARDVMQGRVSLIMLDSIVLLFVVFYIWTHRAQGGA